MISTVKELGYELRLTTVGIEPDIWVIDCETDEKDNFVGMAMCRLFGDERIVYYVSTLDELRSLQSVLSRSKFVGHNLKGDMHWLRGWGIELTGQHIYADTMIMAYANNTMEESYGLKELAKTCLNIERLTYKEVVGKGKAKITLDKQSTETVADYCGCDVLSTKFLYEHFRKSANLELYQKIELPAYRVIYDMEVKGVQVDIERTKVVHAQLMEQGAVLLKKLEDFVGPVPSGKKKDPFKAFNPGSPKQVKTYLFAKLSIDEEETNVKTLVNYTRHDPIKWLLEYRKLTKLSSTYTSMMLNSPTLPRIHARFNQVSYDAQSEDTTGIRTSRLSSSKPNLQNIPSRGQWGPEIRKLFVPKAGHKFVCADYSQVEYRLLAHLTKEPILINAFLNGADVHEETGRLLGLERDKGKTLNFASIYGTGAKKVAFIAGVTESEAEAFLSLYWKKLPVVDNWVRFTKHKAHAEVGVTTLFGRYVSMPLINCPNKYERWHWERAAVNYIIQGSAAEIMKIGMIRLAELGFVPVLSVHDELVYELPEDKAEQAVPIIKSVMENVIKLDVPLVADVGVGRNWEEAK